MAVLSWSITVVGTVAAFLGCALVAMRARAGRRLVALGERCAAMRSGLDNAVGPLGTFVVLASAVMTLVTGVLYAVGVVVRELQPLDWAVYHVVAEVQTDGFVAFMAVATDVAHKKVCWVVAAVTAVVYALVARRRRWVGVVVIGTLVVFQHYQQVALAELIHRGHPPGSGGTFPSGGCARAVAIYGMCALLLLRVTGARRRAVALVSGVVGAVAFFECWSRLGLNYHWVTDVVAGWLSGVLLLAGFAVAAWSLVITRRSR